MGLNFSKKNIKLTKTECMTKPTFSKELAEYFKRWPWTLFVCWNTAKICTVKICYKENGFNKILLTKNK